MKKVIHLILLSILTISCNSKIKDSETKVMIENGTEILEEKPLTEEEKKAKTLGSWVGYFREDTEEKYTNKGVHVDEGFYWNRENKINISIDKITDSTVVGHSVVAGNNRPFSGKVHNGIFIVKEPGNDKYDGEFTFEISKNKLIGKWTAYKDIDIKKRKYELSKMVFSYNPEVLLVKVKEYVDWNTFIEKKSLVDLDKGEFEEWITREFASATKLIYTINASNVLLKKEDVENLKKGDLTIIRNTIYARHGYSFKSRPLRVFFDAQSWYIPIHTNIKSDFTEIEKANIKLLLRYEKNAVEYYDYFGRG
ncbi:MAG: YARHG domain-containing protein [Leadbetterella sp.]